jgi:hypothetical protein
MRIVLLLLLAALAFAQQATTPAYLPNVDTAVVTSTVNLRWLHLNNASGSSATCVIKDRSTNCGGSACSLWGPAPIAASGASGSVVTWSFNAMPAINGFTWSCTVASAVVGSMQY